MQVIAKPRSPHWAISRSGRERPRGSGGKGEVPLHHFKNGEMRRFLEHMELGNDPAHDEDQHKQRYRLVGARCVDGGVIRIELAAQEKHKEDIQESGRHDDVTYRLKIMGPASRFVAVTESGVVHLPGIAYAENGKQTEGLVTHSDQLTDEGQQEGGNQTEKQHAGQRVDDLPALGLEHGHENGG